jgi:hypothetical protein
MRESKKCVYGVLCIVCVKEKEWWWWCKILIIICCKWWEDDDDDDDFLKYFRFWDAVFIIMGWLYFLVGNEYGIR